MYVCRDKEPVRALVSLPYFTIHSTFHPILIRTHPYQNPNHFTIRSCKYQIGGLSNIEPDIDTLHRHQMQ